MAKSRGRSSGYLCHHGSLIKTLGGSSASSSRKRCGLHRRLATPRRGHIRKRPTRRGSRAGQNYHQSCSFSPTSNHLATKSNTTPVQPRFNPINTIPSSKISTMRQAVSVMRWRLDVRPHDWANHCQHTIKIWLWSYRRCMYYTFFFVFVVSTSFSTTRRGEQADNTNFGRWIWSNQWCSGWTVVIKQSTDESHWPRRNVTHQQNVRKTWPPFAMVLRDEAMRWPWEWMNDSGGSPWTNRLTAKLCGGPRKAIMIHKEI